MLRWIGAVALALIASFLLLGVDSAHADRPGDAAAAHAMAAVTTARFDPADPAASFPADYKSVMGYLPTTALGPHGTPILIKPAGDCSSPLGATDYNFDIVCKEHDLSYDVLRYAGIVGHPLPPQARRAADDMFGHDLHARCDQQRLSGLRYATCHLFAESFVEVVGVNSWRQGYRPPGQEDRWQLLSVVLLAAGFLGFPAGHKHLRRRAMSAPWNAGLFPVTPWNTGQVPTLAGRFERTAPLATETRPAAAPAKA